MTSIMALCNAWTSRLMAHTCNPTRPTLSISISKQQMVSISHQAHNCEISSGSTGRANMAGQCKVSYKAYQKKYNVIKSVFISGIWPVLDENGNPVFAEPTAVHRSPDQSLLAVGDGDGHIKLYRYPCLQKKTVPLVDIQAHIGPISRIRFTSDNK